MRGAGLADYFLRRLPRRILQLLDYVAVSCERHRRRVSCLPRDFDHRSALREEERHERMPEVVRAKMVEPSGDGSGSDHALAPVSPVLLGPDTAITRRKNECVVLGAATLDPPLPKIPSQWRQQSDRARLPCLRLLYVTECCRALDEDRPLANVPPAECERFARP